MSDYTLGRIEPAPEGCICPPTSEQTCQNPICPRKPVTIAVRAGTAFNGDLRTDRAADRIEELEAESKRLRLEVRHANDVADAAIDGAKELKAKLAKAVDAIDGLLAILPDDEGPEIDYARTTLAELKREDRG